MSFDEVAVLDLLWSVFGKYDGSAASIEIKRDHDWHVTVNKDDKVVSGKSAILQMAIEKAMTEYRD